MSESPRERAEYVDAFQLLRHFSIPPMLEHGRDPATFVMLLQSGALVVLDQHGYEKIVSAHQVTAGGVPLLELAREHADIRNATRSKILTATGS